MKEMQDFVIRNLNTNVSYSSQREADDAVSIIARDYYVCSGASDKYIIAGVDKDLLQIPGDHYNYVKDTIRYQASWEADRWFFYQLLMGDVADNIPGIKGVGPKKADKILAKGGDAAEWWDLTVEEYAKAYPKYSENELCDMLYERGNMLWIQRRDEQEWYPPIPD
jgi:DNA polymerase-1